MQETEFSDAYRVSHESGRRSIQQEDGLNAEDAVKKILDELEKRAEKIRKMKVYLYQYPLLKVKCSGRGEKYGTG